MAIKSNGDVEAHYRLVTSEAEASIRRLNARLKESADEQERSFGRVKSGLDKISTVAGMATAAAAGLVGVAVKQAAAYEMTNVAFTTLLGSQEKSKRMLQDLRDFAKTTPFQFTDLTTAARRMLALGFASEQIKPMLRNVGDAVAAMGGSPEMFNRVVMALGQIKQKGKLSAEEMLQLAEAGIPAWQFLADAIGTSIPEAMKKSEKGLIDSDTAINAIVKGMGSKFKGAMDDLSKTTAGRWSNLVDSLTEMAIKVGDAFLPTMNKLIDVASGIGSALGRVNPEVLKWGLILLGATAGAAKLASMLLTLRAATIAFTGKRVIDTAATVADTVATEANTAAKLKNAGAIGTAGTAMKVGTGAKVAGAVGNGLSAVAGTVGLSGAAAGAGVAGLYALAIAGIAAVGYELTMTAKYSKDAKEGMKKYNEEFAKTRPATEKRLADARANNAEAIGAGYTGWTNLVKSARAGDKKAMADYARITGKAMDAARITPSAAAGASAPPARDDAAALAAVQEGLRARYAEQDAARNIRRRREDLALQQAGAGATGEAAKAQNALQAAALEQRRAVEDAAAARQRDLAEAQATFQQDKDAQRLAAQKRQIEATYRDAVDQATYQLESRKIELNAQLKDDAIEGMRRRLTEGFNASMVDPRWLEAFRAGVDASMRPALPAAAPDGAGRVAPTVVVNVAGDASKLVTITKQVIGQEFGAAAAGLRR